MHPDARRFIIIERREVLYDVHGEIYGGVEYSQQTVYWADTENGWWDGGKWRGYGRVWDMKWWIKNCENGEDALLMEDRCTIGVIGKGVGKRALQDTGAQNLEMRC